MKMGKYDSLRRFVERNQKFTELTIVNKNPALTLTQVSNCEVNCSADEEHERIAKEHT